MADDKWMAACNAVRNADGIVQFYWANLHWSVSNIGIGWSIIFGGYDPYSVRDTSDIQMAIRAWYNNKIQLPPEEYLTKVFGDSLGL